MIKRCTLNLHERVRIAKTHREEGDLGVVLVNDLRPWEDHDDVPRVGLHSHATDSAVGLPVHTEDRCAHTIDVVVLLVYVLYAVQRRDALKE
eukprot:3339076-Amphidinium_carterae.1